MTKTTTKNNVLAFFRTKKLYIIAIILCFSTLLGARLYVNHFTTGDEPHYLLMEYSLQHDKDLDLKNNYTNKDYLRFYPEYVPPHVSHLNLDNQFSGWYSFHGVGLPLLLLPFYLLAAKSGPAVFMVFIATSVVALTYVWTFIVTNNRKASALASGTLVCCYFFNGLAGYLYPDLVIAALTLTTFIIISTKLYQKMLYQFVLGMLLGAMIFLHFRTLALVLPIALIFLYMHWKKYGSKIPWAFLVPSGLLAAVFFFTLHRWFGVWEPNAIYSSNVGVNIKNLINTPAILFDSLRGSFVYNPILFIIPVGLPIWYKKSKGTFKYVLMLLPIVFVTLGFNEWHGGFSPNGRYLIGLLPVLLPAIAMFYMYAKSYINKVVLVTLLVATFVLSLVAILIKQPYTGYATRSPVFLSIEKHTSIGFDKLFPTYYFIDNSLFDRYGLVQACFWMGVLVLLVIYGIVLSKRKMGATVKMIKNTKKKNKLVYEGRDLEAMDFAVKYHKWILDVFKPYLGKKIVEVGAGSGSFTELIFDLKPDKVIAIEPSAEMYPLLVQSLKGHKARASTRQAFFGDVVADIKKEKPSSIVYINVFEHIENDVDELRALFSVLPKKGKLCIFVPANKWLMSDFDRKIGHFRRYTKQELKQKVSEAGFSVIMLKRFDTIGILPWLIKFRLLRSTSMEPGLTKVYDGIIVPIESALEKRLPTFIGKNLILVAEKT